MEFGARIEETQERRDDEWRDRVHRGAGLLLLVSLTACEPTVDVAGVYFPGWLVSAVFGVLSAYAILILLGRYSRTREFADSGIFFLSLAVAIALTVWWAFFSSF